MIGAEPLEELHKFVLVELPSGEGEKGLVEQGEPSCNYLLLLLLFSERTKSTDLLATHK